MCTRLKIVVAFQIGFTALVYGTLLYIGWDWVTNLPVMLIVVVAGLIVIWVAWLQENERRSAARALGLEVAGSNIHGSIDGFIIFVGPVGHGESRSYQYRIMLSEECHSRPLDEDDLNSLVATAKDWGLQYVSADDRSIVHNAMTSLQDSDVIVAKVRVMIELAQRFLVS